MAENACGSPRRILAKSRGKVCVRNAECSGKLLRHDALSSPWSVVELSVPEDDLGGTFDGKPVDGK
jgi:hypothetical protein